MKLATLIKTTTAAIILSASMATAEIPAEFATDPIVIKLAEQLAEQGYEITDVRITLLGRYKIDAVAPGFEREIVLAPGAGTVLRDKWEATTTTPDTTEVGTDVDGTGLDILDDSDGMGGDDGSDGGSDDRDGVSDGGSDDMGGGSDGGSDDSDGGSDGGSDDTDGGSDDSSDEGVDVEGDGDSGSDDD